MTASTNGRLSILPRRMLVVPGLSTYTPPLGQTIFATSFRLTPYKILMASEIEKLGRFNLVEGLFLKFWWDLGGGGGNGSSGERKREFLLTVSERERKARS
ncbi:hypothetical protein TNIN_336911 [Trichonephila inaurata madagascariensis]|uniref:Uncharacterized protein n=1 Tax=Trichonephila inaurata madagascariensis TaxID=2747483 RepID=A0A8X6WM62_9ARAC|nr:hypothetical protein TNIN_336911 [Trichonephila inaurata madagascariensis]